MFRTIVAATDFSECAQRAVRVATAWARHQGASLEIVHVFEAPQRAVPGGGAWLSPEAESAHGSEVAARLEAVVDAARDEVPAASGVLLRGRPHRAIDEHAASRGADLVVLGTRGLGMIEGALLGSVADRVLRACKSSVLVVPDHARAERLPKVIVVPTDLSASARAAVERVSHLARDLGARVEIVHAWEMPAAVRRGTAIAEDVEGAALANVRETHPSGAGVDTRYHAHESATVPLILRVVDQVHADLVALAPTGRSQLASLLVGGVTDRIVRSSPVPVLLLRETR